LLFMYILWSVGIIIAQNVKQDDYVNVYNVSERRYVNHIMRIA